MRGCEGGWEEREMTGKEGSNSTKLRHYGAFVLTPLLSLLGGRSEMRIDATERTARNDEHSRREDGRKRRLTESRRSRRDCFPRAT